MIENKTAVYVGRFAIEHNGHDETIKYMKENYDTVIVLNGSANRRRSFKNPFNTQVIEQWILENHPDVKFATINDYIYDESKWITQVETIVNALSPTSNITLVGHNRDASSYYLKEFPNWSFDEVGVLAGDVSATVLRNVYFEHNLGDPEINFQLYIDAMNFIKYNVPENVYSYLNDFTETDAYKDIYEEVQYFKQEDKRFENYPYPETLKFSCSDMIVNCNANILLIQRKFAPGKGTWAIPGGFTNRDETFKDCAIRELFEETGIKVPEKVIRKSITQKEVFDNPKRNEGIPRVSNAFYAEIDPDYVGEGYPKLPKVKASDDAMDAQWIPIAKIKDMQLFDDHSDIINYFTKSL